MSAFGRWRLLTAAILTTALLTACGGSSSGQGGPAPRSAVVLMTSGPNSLDPAVGDTPEALEADWLVYTPLLTYEHMGGVPGTRPIPGLATGTPTVSDGGTTYTLSLRPGLYYSDGQPVKASDFTRAVERAVRLWAPAGDLLTSHIAGAAAFAAGRAKTIAGVAADDATGEIQVHLTAPYGEFDNLLALPVLAPVPAGTPLRAESDSPPPGVGLYRFADIVPRRSFSLIVNPSWSKLGLPYLPPAAHLDIDVRITGNAQANVAAVLHNRADLLDWSTTIPSDLVPSIERTAAKRYHRRVINGTYLAFLNVTTKPFSSQLARQAVRAALDQNTLTKLDAGVLWKGCYLIPPGVYGHPQDACPDGNPAGDGNFPLAKALVKRSGMAGSAVTVWTAAEPPEEAWMAYYTALLDQIGFKARLNVIPVAAYYRTIGEQRLHPQTGFAEYYRQIPYPSAFYRGLTGRAISPVGNRNWGEVNDPYIDRTVRLLGHVPAAEVNAVANFWHDVELYVANRAYVVVLGYPTAPEFASDRIDLSQLVFNPAVGFDFSSLRFK